ncbi:SusC/RagA family TonB-linked outer membrane protein [Bacteroidia bacterium]|nr:SusC/RagA family TonB-linked outer membrane protein [Bacteroidia bacterium]
MVSDEADLPLIGVIVKLKGNPQVGTVTDENGRFVLNNIPSDAVLVISLLGYETLEYPVNGVSTFNITLKINQMDLSEFVVIGYGSTQKVKDITGSISHVGPKEIATSAFGSTVSSLLQGRAAGVNVQIQSASPTSPVSVIIRGQSSLSGNNQPLWVVDGIPEYNVGVTGSISNVLYSLNLNDIESIDILKDASSTAIYGSRAANGVVVVTTKGGKEGLTPVIEFSTRVGVSQMDFNSYEYFTAKDYLNFADLAARKEVHNRGVFDYFTRLYLDEQAYWALNTSEVDPSKLQILPGAYYDGDTNWMNEMTQNPFTQQYDLSLRGGSKAVSYLASLSYLDKQGIVKTGYNKLTSGRVRLEARLSKAIKFRINTSGSTRSASDKDYMLDVLKKIRPDIPVYDDDGSLFTRDAYTENPYTTLKNTIKGSGESFNGTAELEWTIIKGLLFTTGGNINYNNYQNLEYKRRGSTFNYDGSRSLSAAKEDTKIWNNTLMYANEIGEHDINASITSSIERYQRGTFSMSATNFPDDDILNNFGSAATKGTLGETYNASSILSEIARVQYKYSNKYLATFTFRADGSSKFGPGKRWGYFPSGGVGWLLSNENFMQKGWIGKNVSHLKLRGSYGKTGSQNLGYYDWMTLVGSGQYLEQPAVVPSNIGNEKLQWENTNMTDLAMELELFESRIRGSFGYFDKTSDYLIYSQPLPPSSAFANMNDNIASTKAHGFEFSLAADLIRNKNVLFTIDVNGSRNKAFITKFNRTILELPIPNSTSPTSILKEGKEIGIFYGYKTYGRLFGTSEEASALKGRTVTGGQVMYKNNYEQAGDIYIQDTNGDNLITTADKTDLGSSIPKLFGGFNFNLQLYQNWNINANFVYSYGNKRFWAMPSEDVGYVGNYNHSNKIAGNSATLKNAYDATIPNMTHYGDGGNSDFSDFWLYDASYVRLNALNLTYRLPRNWFAGTMVDAIEFSLQATNLFTLTSYPGFDPQGNFSTGTSMTSPLGRDYSYYPSAKTYNIGLKFTFK